MCQNKTKSVQKQKKITSAKLLDELDTYLSLTWPDTSLAESWTSKASTQFGSESKQINNDLGISE
jgi:hypothetical protein